MPTEFERNRMKTVGGVGFFSENRKIAIKIAFVIVARFCMQIYIGSLVEYAYRV